MRTHEHVQASWLESFEERLNQVCRIIVGLWVMRDDPIGLIRLGSNARGVRAVSIATPRRARSTSTHKLKTPRSARCKTTKICAICATHVPKSDAHATWERYKITSHAYAT